MNQATPMNAKARRGPGLRLKKCRQCDVLKILSQKSTDAVKADALIEYLVERGWPWNQTASIFVDRVDDAKQREGGAA